MMAESIAKLTERPPIDAGQPGPDPTGTGSPGIMSLLNPGQGISPELKNEFIKLQRGKMDATGQIQAENEQRYNEDRERVLDQYGAENATINDIPKWDVEAERKKYHTDPLESFGSFASIFAMVASAFTRAPMENALNGAAAAMNAKRENNEFEYQRSMDAFKLNSDLAIKRFNMQHAAMQDAFGVMEKDVQRGNAKLLETATKYGDEQVLALYNAGMFPEIQKLEDSRLKANEGVVNAITNYRRMEDQEKRTKQIEQRDQLRAEIERQKIVVSQERDETKRALEQQKLDALNNRFVQTLGVQQQNADTAAKRAEIERQKIVVSQERDETKRALEQQKLDALNNRFVQTLGVQQQNADTAAKRAEIAATKAPVVTPEREKELEAQRRVRAKQEHPDPTDSFWDTERQRMKDWETAHQEVTKATEKPMTANRRDQLRVHVSQYDQQLREIDRAIKLIEKFGDVGLGGKIKRGAQTVGNIFGASNRTDARQVEAVLSELRLRAPALLTQSNTGTPRLKAAYELIENALPGLEMGATSQSVLDQLRHLKTEFAGFRDSTRERLDGGTSSGSSTEAKPAAAKPAEPKSEWWKDGVPVQ